MKLRNLTLLVVTLFLITSLVAGCSDTKPAQTAAPTADKAMGNKAGANVVAASQAKYDDYVIRVVAGTGLCGAPLHMAIELGYFKDEGVQIEVTKAGGPAFFDLISTGKADAGYAMVPDTVLRIDKGMDARAALGMHTGCLQIVVKSDSNITDVKQLKGLKIGVPGLASSGHVFASRALQNAGIGVSADKMEVEFAAFNAAELAMVLENGIVDAVAVNDPTAGNIIKNGIGRSILANASHPDYKDEICCIAVMTPDFVDKHPYAAAAFVRALQKGGKFVTENPEKAAALQIEKGYIPSGDPNFYAQLLQSYSFTATVEGGRTGLENNMRDLQQIGFINRELDIEKVMNRVYVTFDNVPDSLPK